MTSPALPPPSRQRPSSASRSLAVLVASVALSSVPLPVARAQEELSTQSTSSSCADDRIVSSGCDPSPEFCSANCNLFGSTYLTDKCCKHAGINAVFLAFEDSDVWIPRIDEYNRCTGASVRISYHPDGEDGMGDALIEDVGLNENEDSGQGIYDAYIVQAPWLPPVFAGLQSLSEYIKVYDEFIDFQDINQASRSAVSFEGEVRALPLDVDYVAMGWRQDVFENTEIKMAYYATWGEELKVPETIEEMVVVSERLNGRHDYNNDGVMDLGFCLTPQTNYFHAFLAPVMQTHLRQCKEVNGGVKCLGANTGQNVFFDIDNFDALIFNVG